MRKQKDLSAKSKPNCGIKTDEQTRTRVAVLLVQVVRGQVGELTTMILSDTELKDLTGRSRKTSQVQVLRFMGIEHKVRPDGSVAVLKAHVEQALGVTDTPNRKKQNTEPNWSAV
jgi:hypothetical protein